MPSLGGMAPAPGSTETRPAWESIRPGVRPAQGWAPLWFLGGAPLVTPQGRAGGGYRSHLPESGPLGPASTLHVALTQPGPAGLSCGLQHGLCLNWLGSPASSPHTRATSLKVNETLWLPVVLTRGSHASLCVSVCVCVLLVFFFQMTKSVTNPEELGGLASQMTSDYGQLALQGQLAAATAEPEEVCHLKSLCLDANPH